MRMCDSIKTLFFSMPEKRTKNITSSREWNERKYYVFRSIENRCRMQCLQRKSFVLLLVLMLLLCMRIIVKFVGFQHVNAINEFHATMSMLLSQDRNALKNFQIVCHRNVRKMNWKQNLTHSLALSHTLKATKWMEFVRRMRKKVRRNRKCERKTLNSPL